MTVGERINFILQSVVMVTVCMVNAIMLIDVVTV
jgi:hypothetical protein